MTERLSWEIELEEIRADSPRMDLLRSKYRGKLAQVLQAARQYSGTEPSYRTVLDTLIDLESWIRETFKTGREKAVPPALEATLQEQFHSSIMGPRDIDSVLSIATQSFGARIKRIIDPTIHRVELDFPLLQPGSTPPPPGGDEPSNEFERRPMERLRELLVFLNEKGVYTDDVTLAYGPLPKNSMRKTSYVLVEIPRLNRQILVCDEVGEATFVVLGMFDRKELGLSKETLQGKHLENFRQVIYRNKEQWLKELNESLFEGNPLEEKVDLPEMERLRSAIFDRYPSSKDWADIKNRHSFDILGIKMTAIGSKFGFKDNMRARYERHLKLGLRIYGDQDVYLHTLMDIETGNKERIVGLIREAHPDGGIG